MSARSAIVCGAGVLGASVADRLARSGWAVTLVEPVTPGHVRAGSGGESRLIRHCHGDDRWHVRSAVRAAILWDELDPTVRVPAGVAWFVRDEHGFEAASERVLREEGIAVERLTPAQARARGWFPSLNTDDLAFVLWEPDAGILRAREGVRALAARAVAHGAELEVGTARPAGGDASVVVLEETGRQLRADVVVWACGAWMPGLFPEHLGAVRVTQQDVLFYGAPGAWATPGVPGWVDYDAGVYGLGDLDGRGFKVAPDGPGPEVDPDALRRLPHAAHEQAARAALAHRFPALARAPVVFSRTCQYETTPDSRFVIAPHPDHDGAVWLLGGGSGHAFKHGPALAEHVEAWIDGAPPQPMFALGPREPDAPLRTGSR
ncbi:NAD(P)/FAD-dependent oxidoreductase [Paraconexibacter algicola]|uniref:FAD dependent oxidoreductase domain-containing protein n=1 Tax=Paraconexibacter algicola TaxID=2133960 RepID=A0A2T4UHP3_9ACTN|nr:FAD-dependent oxidoreductase [Paraconexibacter algicola]PTL58764.1 hypothetical protein C7Y72_03425 [Paraconexibacter algicola]